MSDAELRQLTEILAEERRRNELALTLYRPTPKQEAFHRCRVGERIVRGGHRSGKSTAGALETAHAATRIPITTTDGKTVPYKYPKRPLRIWIIGKDEDHIGDTIYTLLFKGGLFYVIDDEETGVPRIWNPNIASDMARKAERRQSGPMIPPEMVKSFTWTNKGKRVFSKAVMKNGTEIFAYPSGGDCPSGVPVDLIWVDEDIKYPEYVADWQGRLIDRGGRFIWTAFPWARNDALVEMSERAQKVADNPNADIREFQLFMSENPYLDPDEIRKAQDRWEAAGSDVLAARDRGEFPHDKVRMYPEFRKDVHGISDDFFPVGHAAAEILHANGGEPPDDWMRLLALDPGSARCAVVFAAVPPPDLGNDLFIYDEVFQENSDAKSLAKEVQVRTHGRSFYRFLIDEHAGRQTAMGFGVRIRQAYIDAFRARDIRSDAGYAFTPGTDDVKFRAEMVRQRLRIQDGRTQPGIFFWLPRTQRLQWEFLKYSRRLSNREYDDVPIAVHNDAINCMEYLVAADIPYHKPRPNNRRPMVLQQWDAVSSFFSSRRPKEQHSVVMGAASNE